MNSIRTPPLRNIPFIISFLALIICICSSCSKLAYEIRITNTDINERLSAKFPLTRTYLQIFKVILSNPRVILHDNANRITLGINVDVFNMLNERLSFLSGTVAATSSIHFNNKTGGFYLSDVVFDKLSVSGLVGTQRLIIEGFIGAALREYLARMPIYTLRATDLKTAIVRLVIKEVRIIDGVLIVKLGG